MYRTVGWILISFSKALASRTGDTWGAYLRGRVWCFGNTADQVYRSFRDFQQLMVDRGEQTDWCRWT